MNLTLSWDLFILVFFALVIGYTFIIGKKEAVKIIVASYMAIVAVQGLGNFLQRMVGTLPPSFDLLGFTVNFPIVSILKMILFVGIVILLAVRAGFAIQYATDMGVVTNVAVTVLLGFASALLLLSTIIAYIGESPILAMSTAVPVASGFGQSKLLPLLLTYQDLWFALPAIVLIAVGFVGNRS